MWPFNFLKKEIAKKTESISPYDSYLLLHSIREKLKVYNDGLIEDFKKVPCDLEVGDECILNIYELNKPGTNGWDGGPASLLRYNRNITSPLTMVIKEVNVSVSLNDEIIKDFIESFTYNIKDNDENYIIHNFERYLQSRTRNSIGNRYGLYYDIHFDYVSEFQPKWGLNSNSFLLLHSPEGQETYNIWAEELELTSKMTELRQAEIPLKKRKNEIYSKYRRAYYN